MLNKDKITKNVLLVLAEKYNIAIDGSKEVLRERLATLMTRLSKANVNQELKTAKARAPKLKARGPTVSRSRQSASYDSYYRSHLLFTIQE